MTSRQLECDDSIVTQMTSRQNAMTVLWHKWHI